MDPAARAPNVSLMYAVIGIWTLDEARRDEQLRALQDEVVPEATRTPDFVNGYWMRDPETGKAHSIVVFTTSAAARTYQAVISSRSQAAARLGITADVLRTVDVVVSAADPAKAA
jgi:hypothetical protein